MPLHPEGSAVLFQPEKIDKSIVCPICWKSQCPLFQKLHHLCFTDEERSWRVRHFHKQVCERCKRQRCKPFPKYMTCEAGGRMQVGIIPCFAHPAKKLGRKKRLPEWWSSDGPNGLSTAVPSSGGVPIT